MRKQTLLLYVIVQFFLLSVSYLQAILDGRVTSIHLDTRYTFTQGEWARGSVYFRDGFDLPAGGTVYLGIDSGFVSSTVNLNGGTLALQAPLEFIKDGHLEGSGFISGLTNYSRLILYARSSPGLIEGSGTIKFLSPMTLQATTQNAEFTPWIAIEKLI